MRACHAQLGAVVIALFVSACAPDHPSKSAADAPAEGGEATSATRAAFDQYVHAFWSEGDTTALLRGISPTMIYHYNGRLIPSDPQRHLANLRAWRQNFPDLIAVTDVYTGSGEYGAAATTWTGTYRGPICGKPSTGQQVSWSVNYVFRVADARIVELWETWDEVSVPKQLGIPFGKCEA